MKIAIGSDERTAVTDAIVADIEARGHELVLVGPLEDEEAYWPAVAQEVAEMVACGSVDEGILFCWTGTGVSMAANKVPGIRAALCDDAQTAEGARLWNNANVLCLSLRRTTDVVGKEILDAWFSTSYQPNEVDDTCLAQLNAIEAAYAQ